MNDIFDKSILVSAHPDDEVLWNSSILTRVDDIVICFLGLKSEPETHLGRQRSLGAYPLSNMSCLGLDEGEVFYGVDWDNPVLTPYGIKVTDKKYPDMTYRANYDCLKDRLQARLAGYSNVFTHNPWGEYGNNEHVQIYRVVRELQKDMKYDLWFSNYCSNKSFRLMSKYVQGFNEYVTFRTDDKIADELKKLYQANNCWTWYADWHWPKEESFIKDEITVKNNENIGEIVPLNFVKVRVGQKPPAGTQRIVRRLRKMLYRTFKSTVKADEKSN